jgi:DNA-binding Lrp family transcriptional regulator
MIEAYVLIETELGRASEIEHRCEEFDEVIHADVVTGCYDVLARIRLDSIEDLPEIELRMKAQQGVTRVLSCPVTHMMEASHRGWQPLHAPV